MNKERGTMNSGSMMWLSAHFPSTSNHQEAIFSPLSSELPRETEDTYLPRLHTTNSKQHAHPDATSRSARSARSLGRECGSFHRVGNAQKDEWSTLRCDGKLVISMRNGLHDKDDMLRRDEHETDETETDYDEPA